MKQLKFLMVAFTLLMVFLFFLSLLRGFLAQRKYLVGKF